MGDGIRIGALISGGGTNLQAIIDSCEAGGIDGRMVFVGSDKGGVRGLERAAKHGIPGFVVEYGDIIRAYRRDPSSLSLPEGCDLEALIARQSLFDEGADPGRVRAFFTTRVIAEQRMLDAMAARPFDLLVLAGFMRNLTPWFIDRVNTDPARPRIMNIHPALLPAFPGTDGYGDTWRYGCRVGGCTVHFIDYGEDSGPIIGQRAFEIRSDDSLDDVKRNGLAEEWKLYPACIQLFARGLLETVAETRETDDGRQVTRTVVKIRKG